MTALLLLPSNENTVTTVHRHQGAFAAVALGNGEMLAHYDEGSAEDEKVENIPCTVSSQQQQQQQQNQSIFFRYMDGKTYCLWLDPNLTVLQVKMMLVEHVQKCNNKMMLKSCDGGEYVENQCPRLLSLVESKYSIDTKETTATTICSTSDTAHSTLATTTTTRRGMDLCMVLQGKPLEDDTAFSHYIPLLKQQRNNNNSAALTTIVVWQRQRGGCFMVSFSILIIIFFSLISSCCTCGLSLLVVPVLLPLLFILPLFCL